MTIEALADVYPGPVAGDAERPGGDTYETSRTFESLGVSLELNKALADAGIVSAFPIQALTVADALAGRDVCGKAKTGSGKTLAFGVPLLQRTKATRESQGDDPSGRPARPLALVLLPDARAGRTGPRGPRARWPASSACTPSPSTAAPTSTARWPSSARVSTSSSPPPDGSSTSATEARCRSTASRRWCSTKPTAWPTWASCHRLSGCCGVSTSPTRRSSSRPPSTARWTCSSSVT